MSKKIPFFLIQVNRDELQLEKYKLRTDYWLDFFNQMIKLAMKAQIVVFVLDELEEKLLILHVIKYLNLNLVEEKETKIKLKQYYYFNILYGVEGNVAKFLESNPLRDPYLSNVHPNIGIIISFDDKFCFAKKIAKTQGL